MLKQFGEYSPEVQQKRKYAAWRAGTINQALQQGKVPDPPPQAQFNEDDEALLSTLNELPVPGSTPTEAAPIVFPPPSVSPPVVVAPIVPQPPIAPQQQPKPQSPPPPPPPSLPKQQQPHPPPPPKIPEPRDEINSYALPPLPPTEQFDPQPPPPSSSNYSQPRPVRQFEKGQTVLYLPPGSIGVQPLQGVIAKITLGARGKEIYHVAVKDKTVQAEAYSLAPALKEGDEVTYFPETGGAPVTVTVEEVYASRWPPSYMVQKHGGGLETVEDECIGITPPPAMHGGAHLAAVPEDEGGENEGDEGGMGVTRSDSMEVGLHTMMPAAVAANLKAQIAEHMAKKQQQQQEGGKVGGGVLPSVPSVVPEETEEEESVTMPQPPVAPVPPPTQQPKPQPPPRSIVAPNDTPLSPFATPAMPPPMPPSSSTTTSAYPKPPVLPPPVQPQTTTTQHAPSFHQSTSAHVAAHPVTVAAIDSPATAAQPAPDYTLDPNVQLSVKELLEAEKMAKTAASSISFEDVPTAVKYLQDALKLLTSGGKKQ